ncbi:Calcium/calmodulin-dependent protein kinase type I [Dimargaris verticillata]|uniref:Calcium/calmodulin-dependent protein kinase type I n=1 Tax=Dimargaris verticillata TaxID=2761393 RepID=A0A9W8BC72_9FUNG|nr:Calcium/calmodulin-dependent protein kinase type I [Dimargaris verticillata]
MLSVPSLQTTVRHEPPVTECPYRLGSVIGTGTYAMVREACHTHTGQTFAAKVINKHFVQGKEHLLHNEVKVLKQISQAHPNLLNLHDCFETKHNVYLITELATGGDLFDRLQSKGSFYESEVVVIIRSVLRGLAYLHQHDIVHRDIKPENILFRQQDDDADLLIADFGLSTIVGQQALLPDLCTRCGTAGYMAPEILAEQAYGKPVDLWAVGVLTYLLLSGYMPFEYGNHGGSSEDYALIHEGFDRGTLYFDPPELWTGLSNRSKDFISHLLALDPAQRMTAEQALSHPWLRSFDHRFPANIIATRGLSVPASLAPWRWFFRGGNLFSAPAKPTVTTAIDPPTTTRAISPQLLPTPPSAAPPLSTPMGNGANPLANNGTNNAQIEPVARSTAANASSAYLAVPVTSSNPKHALGQTAYPPAPLNTKTDHWSQLTGSGKGGCRQLAQALAGVQPPPSSPIESFDMCTFTSHSCGPNLKPRIFNPRRTFRKAVEVVVLCVALSQAVDYKLMDERPDHMLVKPLVL